jgi:hypothetical protein
VIEKLLSEMEYRFFKDTFIYKAIMKTVKLPITGKVSHIKDIYIGMDEATLNKILKDCILRSHKDPIRELLAEFIKPSQKRSETIDNVLSVNAWPEIYRHVIHNGKLVAVIIEIGIDSAKFVNIYNKIKNTISEIFAYSIVGEPQQNSPYETYDWEYSKHFCYLQVLNDRLANISPLHHDWSYFGTDLDGTFIRKDNRPYSVLPTIAIIFSKEEKYRSDSILYLNLDILKRRESISLLNLPY